MELYTPTQEENLNIDNLNPAYTKVSEMTVEERQFLNGLILKNKPVKLLELGVSAGGSSVIMLNAIKNNPNAVLHSVDFSEDWYQDPSKKTGFTVDQYPELKSHWKLHTGGLASQFMKEIGGGIDFCLIDTMHANPGELLDTLMVLPFLNDNAIIVYHDVNLQTASGKIPECNPFRSYTNNLLMSAVHGKKLIQGNFSRESAMPHLDRMSYFPNIGAIQINAETKSHVFEIFNLLTLKWDYMLSVKEEEQLLNYFSEFYDPYFIDYLKKVFQFHRACFQYKVDYDSPKYLSKQLFKTLLGRRAVDFLVKLKGK